MEANLRIALFTGLGLAVLYVIGRTVMHGGGRWPITDLLDAVILALAPLPFPGAVEMLNKATQAGELPMLNTGEDRVALFFGGALLACAIVFTCLVASKRGWQAPTSTGE